MDEGLEPTVDEATNIGVPAVAPMNEVVSSAPTPKVQSYEPPAGYPEQVPPQPAPAVPQPMRRAPVNYEPAEAGWWLATDGLWYPPESLAPAPAPSQQPVISNPGAGSQNVVVNVVAPTMNTAGIVTGPPKSKVAAGLLAIFLGVFGVHRFYMGYSGVGVAMLLLTILSVGFLAPFVALWALIEGVVILCGGMRDRWGRQLV